MRLKSIPLSFGNLNNAETVTRDKSSNTADDPTKPLLTYRTENKVGILLRHIFKFGLSSIQKTFSQNPPEPIAIFDWFTL